MERLKYTPDDDIKVHEEGAIRLICKAFQSHENGLPEWLKNSADAYARENAAEGKRVIVLLFNHGDKKKKSSISCLDFVGMTSTNIERDFRIWADPEAASRDSKGQGVQGGHGNGGKCYMTQMFDEYSEIHSVKNNLRCKYGTISGSVRFGYIPNREDGRDVKISDFNDELTSALSKLGCSLNNLPHSAIKAISISAGFTLITGIGCKGYRDKIPLDHLIESIISHPQMMMTLELCEVYVLVNGNLYDKGRKLTYPEITPMQGAEIPREIPIPISLKDPFSDEEISTIMDVSEDKQGKLVLRTSNVSMRYRKKTRHNIIYKSLSGFIGYISILELDVESPYRDRIYGECYLDSIDAFKQNERARLAKSPLTRALDQFISEEVQKYAKEFEAKDRRRVDQEEKNALSKMNDALDKWKNKFLKELLSGLWGPGSGLGPTPDLPLPTGKLASIEITTSHSLAGLGISFRPIIKFYDQNRKRIRPVPFHWVSDDTNIAMVNEDLLVVNTFSIGKTHIYAETLDGGFVSNKVPLEVVCIYHMRIEPREIELPIGSRYKLDAICKLDSGEETSDVYLEWIEGNSSVARVSSSGLVYGLALGETEIIAGDDHFTAKEPAFVKVLEGQARGPGDKKGGGFPRILISEVDPDPETNDIVVFSSEDPPVCQNPRDVDRNIWWINSAAPFARLYLDIDQGYGYQTREWRMYHLERYTDIFVQIALTHGPYEMENLSSSEWILRWGEQASGIQEIAVSSLKDFIAFGTLPDVK